MLTTSAQDQAISTKYYKSTIMHTKLMEEISERGRLKENQEDCDFKNNSHYPKSDIDLRPS